MSASAKTKNAEKPTLLAEWKRRALAAEAEIEAMHIRNREAGGKRMNTELAAVTAVQRRVDAAKTLAFDATAANSRYVRQDNAIRELLNIWAAGDKPAVTTCWAIAEVMHAKLPPRFRWEDADGNIKFEIDRPQAEALREFLGWYLDHRK